NNAQGFAGTQYYQIKQIDYDGKFSWSKLLSVTIENPLRIEQVLPNPFNKEVVLHYSAAHGAVAKVYGATGKLFAQTQLEPHESGRQQLELGELLPGLYFLVLQDLSTQQRVSIRLVKL
ncbi:MAG: T9SS type A sorting domain-containing protein, partial [Sphaerospermopsis sp.]|nr:T9SS type A sorting domain-containing protein [Sphaerospermopsis sp.]